MAVNSVLTTLTTVTIRRCSGRQHLENNQEEIMENRVLCPLHLTTSGWIIAVLIAVIMFSGSGQLIALAAPETAITVNSFSDAVDANPGDGVCATATGVCTLRAAIQEANALPGDDVIILRTGIYTLSILGRNEDNSATGDLDIRSNIAIRGAGSDVTTITAAQIDRIFHLLSGTILIEGVTLSNGLADGISSQGDGGAIYAAVGVNLTLVESKLLSNEAVHWGGGLYMDQGVVALVDHCTFGQNKAGELGGGLDNYNGTATIVESAFLNNQAGNSGGGLYNDANGVLTLNRVTVSNNTASVDGAGLYNDGGRGLSTGSLTVNNTTFSANHATLNGGGLYNFGKVTLIENSTFSSNLADDAGGAIYNNGAVTNINFSTIYGNRATGLGGGIYNGVNHPLSLQNTILASNVQANCYFVDNNDVNSLGYNLENGNSCDLGANGDIVSTDPLLGTLATNGGPTMTHMPAEGSQAIGSAQPNSTLASDQRGVARPQGIAKDIGAAEREMADLSITKSDATDPVYAGTEIVYRLIARNAGQSRASAVVVTDELPTGVTFISATVITPNTCSYSTQVVTCNIQQIVVNEQVEITIRVQAPVTPGQISNKVTIRSAVSDPAPDNNTAVEKTIVLASADLALVKSATPNPVRAGDPLQVLLEVTNAGPSVAAAVVVTDTLSAGVNFANWQGSGWTCAFNTVTRIVRCQRGDLPVGAAPVLVLNVTAPAEGGPLYNTAQVSSASYDAVAANNVAETWTDVTATANLRILKQDVVDPVHARENLTYTLQVDNYGPSTATNVTLVDSLPADTIFVTATGPTGWECKYDNVAHRVTCTNTSLLTGAASQYLTIVVKASAEPAILTNQATITADEIEPDTSDNSASATTEVLASADLEIAQTHSPDSVQSGADLTYFLTVENAGPSTATSVLVTSQLPEDVTIKDVTGGDGWVCSFNSNVNLVTCTRSTLDVGLAPTITVVVIAPSTDGTTQNVALVGATPADFDPTDNTSTETVFVGSVADVAITLSDNPDPVITLASLIYTIEINNLGPSRSDNLTVTQILPSAVSFVRATGGDWSCSYDRNFHRVTCTRLYLLSGVTSTINVIVTTPAAGTVIESTATVATTTTDPVQDNNRDAETTYVNPSDLKIEWTNPPQYPAVTGQRSEYILKVTNLGPGDALSPFVTVNLPLLAEYNSCAGSCTYNNHIITFALPDMPVQAVQYATFEATASQDGHFYAIAWIHSDVVADNFTVNNSVHVLINTWMVFFPMLDGCDAGAACPESFWRIFVPLVELCQFDLSCQVGLPPGSAGN